MKQFAIIGLSRFGRRLLEELIESGVEILIIDKKSDIIDLYKNKVASAYVADAISEEIIRKLVPSTIDAAVVDLGERIEVSILVTNYLKKIGVKNIIAKAETDEHGEILKIVGADRVVFPNREAANRIAPLLLSSLIFSYLPVSKDFVIAEIKVPKQYAGKSLIDVDFRKQHSLNVIGFRTTEDDYVLFSPEYRLSMDDILLVGGSEENISSFTDEKVILTSKKITGLFKKFFSKK